jgi:hypothetical protein
MLGKSSFHQSVGVIPSFTLSGVRELTVMTFRL